MNNALSTFNKDKLDLPATSVTQRNKSLLTGTKTKLNTIFKSFDEIISNMGEKSKRTVSTADVQTETSNPKEITYSNLNCMNLLKELAREIL